MNTPKYIQALSIPPKTVDISKYKKIFSRLWAYAKWSTNILRPAFGEPNHYKDGRERLHFKWLSKEEHKNLIGYLDWYQETRRTSNAEKEIKSILNYKLSRYVFSWFHFFKFYQIHLWKSKEEMNYYKNRWREDARLKDKRNHVLKVFGGDTKSGEVYASCKHCGKRKVFKNREESKINEVLGLCKDAKDEFDISFRALTKEEYSEHFKIPIDKLPSDYNYYE